MKRREDLIVQTIEAMKKTILLYEENQEGLSSYLMMLGQNFNMVAVLLQEQGFPIK